MSTFTKGHASTAAVASRVSSFYFYSAVFLITSSTLMLQVVQTRILSVVAWYHLAFFVIGIAMFGLTAGAVWVFLQRERFTAQTLSFDLANFSTGFAVATACGLIIQMFLAPLPAVTVTAVLIWVALAICLAVPFFFSGVVVSLALTRSPFPIGRVYGVDMVGAAMGCLGVLVLLNSTDGPSAVLWVSAVGALAAHLFAASGIGQAPRDTQAVGPQLRRRGLLVMVLILCALINGHSERGLHPILVKGKIEILNKYPLFKEWNSFSRIAVFDVGKRPPILTGPSPNFVPDAWSVEQRFMNIDGDAATLAFGVRGKIEEAGFLKFDVTNLAYHMPQIADAAVIGVGGGRDMLSARVFGVPRITGVEINPIFVRLLTDEPDYADFTGLHTAEGMTFETDEARSWFARTEQKFDLVQMSLIDTWAATGAGAFTLSENGLYTVEAWRIFLDHLTPRGVFTVSRWYAPGEVNETGRMVSLASAVLLSRGVAEPKKHIFLATSRRIATMIVSAEPFSPAAIDKLEGAANRLGFPILISPRGEPNSAVLKTIVDSRSRADLDAYTGSLELDLTPATDERPFFFNQLPLHDPVRAMKIGLTKMGGAGINAGNVRATGTLVMLFLISAALVLATIVIPLRPAIKDVGGALAFGGTMYFLLIGVGFMSVEIGLLQRLSVFLGHPMYSLSIVLFSIVLATGVGSLISDRLALDSRTKFAVWAALTGGYIVLLPQWLPAVTLAFDGETLFLRALISVLIIAPAGVLMGWGFPTGMRLISAVDRTPTPWFWGINGAAGVLASALAVAVSIAFGISVTLIIGGICYLLLIPAALMVGFVPPNRVPGSPNAFSYPQTDTA